VADPIRQPDGAANLDPVGTGDVPSADASLDPTIVGDSSEEAGADFVVGDPGLAGGTEIDGATAAPGVPANPLPPAQSSATGSAIQLSG